jgi:hypothetical protein
MRNREIALENVGLAAQCNRNWPYYPPKDALKGHFEPSTLKRSLGPGKPGLCIRFGLASENPSVWFRLDRALIFLVCEAGRGRYIPDVRSIAVLTVHPCRDQSRGIVGS